MPSLSPAMLGLFFASIALQIVMLSALPLSKGYTQPWPTAVAVVSVNLAMFLLARLFHSGAQLSILVPLSATIIPLGAIALGLFVYGEPAPMMKVVLLLIAAVVIGAASAVK